MLRRFPWTLAVAALAAFSAIVGSLSGTDDAWERLAFVAALGLPLTIALTLLAMLAFAMKVALASHEIEDADLERLGKAGFTEEDAWDIAAIAGFFALSNRMANVTGMRPNDEFYLMGRVPTGK